MLAIHMDWGPSLAVYAAIGIDHQPDVLLNTFECDIMAFGHLLVQATSPDGADSICDK